MDYTSENLEKAVNLFYQSDPSHQAEAHRWLTEAQSSQQAWSFVWELLSPYKTSEVQFFAATTLHMKLLKHWSEVPVDHYEPLKTRILEAIISYASGPKIVLNRLCITLSTYIIHTVPQYWPNAFEELVSSFQPHNLPQLDPKCISWILLEILTVIPEELQSTVVSPGQRNRIRKVLQDVSKYIMNVVEMNLVPAQGQRFDSNNVLTYLNAVRCCTTWIELEGLNIEECSNISNILIELTCAVYWNKDPVDGVALEDLEIMESSVEALTAVVQLPLASKFQTQVTKFAANALYKFEKILDEERISSDANKDVVVSLYGLLINLADTHSKIFISLCSSSNEEEQKLAFDLFSCILKCTNLPGYYPIHESSSTLAFGFWYTLQDDILAMEPAASAKLILLVRPIYKDLVCIMLRKSMLPEPDNAIWSADDREIFRCYRQDIADTFMYCYNVINIEMLDILYTKLTESLEKNKTDGGLLNWSEIESCLHAYRSVAECIEVENFYLPKLMLSIKEIPFHLLPPRVMASALETVGSYSEWLLQHPELLENVFPLVITALGNIEVATSATMALKDLTQCCQKYILPYADHILFTANTVLQSGMLKLGESRRLMFSIGKVLSILPVNRIMEYLNLLLAPYIEELQKLIHADITPGVTSSIITKLKMLTAMFNSLRVEPISSNEEQPTLVIMKNTLPIYKLIAEKYCKKTDVIEDLAALLKCAITTLMDDSKAIVNEILQIVLVIYKNCPQSSVLDVTNVISIMFGREPDFKITIRQVMHEVVNTTFQMCFQNNAELSEKSDVLEGFFSMLARLSKKVPDMIFNSDMDTTSLFQCAIVCLSLQETQTLKVTSSFLSNFISQTSQATTVSNNMHNLLLTIFLKLGTNAPRTSVEAYSEILFALNKNHGELFSKSLHSLLDQAEFPSNKVSPNYKEQFIKSILREKANKRKFHELVLEFTLICRGILKEDLSLY